MSLTDIAIRNAGIRKTLNHIGVEDAICEYLWNGFDAGASKVDIQFHYSSPFGQPGSFLDVIDKIIVTDNGAGIDHSQLAQKFTPFLESEKAQKKKEENIAMKGKNGYGRLTFFKFAQKALWETVYGTGDNSNVAYNIRINASSLQQYDPTEPSSTDLPKGTKVTFTEVIIQDANATFAADKLIPFIRNEFSWFLELNKDRGYEILVNGEAITYEHLIKSRETFPIEVLSTDRKTKQQFECQYLQWAEKLNDEFSRFYFINEEGRLKYQQTTKLNKKGDYFYHSIIVKSAFFNNFVYTAEEIADETQSARLFPLSEDYKTFKDLNHALNTFLKKKRKPFLQSYSGQLIKKFEEEKVMPAFGNNPWDTVRKNEFESLVRELYEVEPALFVKLNFEQKKTFLHLLNLVLDSDERDGLFKILEEVVKLDTEEREELKTMLQATRLSNIIKATKLVHDRILSIEAIKQLVFNHTLAANERDHLQKAIELHYWIFGEQYSLVCAAEVKFEEALRRYLYVLRGEKQKKGIEHPGKYKEMDIFLIRQSYGSTHISNVVVELKSPSHIKKLTQKEFMQVQNYMSTILSVDEFNGVNASWEFYLIGQDYDDFISQQLENAKNHGEASLAFKAKNYKVYVKKWSEVMNDVEIRLRWLNEKLLIEREKIAQDNSTSVAIINQLNGNSARQPGQVIAG